MKLAPTKTFTPSCNMKTRCRFHVPAGLVTITGSSSRLFQVKQGQLIVNLLVRPLKSWRLLGEVFSDASVVGVTQRLQRILHGWSTQQQTTGVMTELTVGRHFFSAQKCVPPVPGNESHWGDQAVAVWLSGLLFVNVHSPPGHDAATPVLFGSIWCQHELDKKIGLRLGISIFLPKHHKRGNSFLTIEVRFWETP